MPAVRRFSAQLVFILTVERQLNYTLLTVGVMGGRHWPDQYHLLDLMSLLRLDFKLFTKLNFAGCRIDYRPCAFEHIGRAENLYSIIVPAAGHHLASRLQQRM